MRKKNACNRTLKLFQIKVNFKHQSCSVNLTFLHRESTETL